MQLIRNSKLTVATALEAEQVRRFKELATERGTTPAALLRDFIETELAKSSTTDPKESTP